MNLQWSDYAIQTFREASDYIAEQFYPEYADAYESDVFMTAETLLTDPNIGCEAYPGINRPDLRKILCRNRNWWIFYRLYPDTIEISQVSHTLRNNDNPFSL